MFVVEGDDPPAVSEAPNLLVAVMCRRSSSADSGESIQRSAWKWNSWELSRDGVLRNFSLGTGNVVASEGA